MAAVASNHIPEGLRGIDEQFSEAGTSTRFTAVNGRGTPPATDRNSAPNGHDETRKPESPASAESEKMHDVITVQQPSPAPRQLNPEHHRALMVDRATPYSSHGASTTSPSPPTRKRSFPEAFGDTDADGGPHLSQPHRAHTPSLDYSRGANGPYPPAAGKLPLHHQIEHDRQQPPLSSEYDPHAQTTQPYYTQPTHDDSEVRLAEALQRENGNAGMTRETFVSPDDDDPHRQQYAEYSASRSSMAEAERKRRKRVFSNRTKTGCMTCRKRKKKCDEQHPECKLHLRSETASRRCGNSTLIQVFLWRLRLIHRLMLCRQQLPQRRIRMRRLYRS